MPAAAPQTLAPETPAPETPAPEAPGQKGPARWHAPAAYALAAALSLIAATLVLRLWDADLRVPFDYDGDVVYFSMVIKAIIEAGWYLTIPRLGAPGVLTMHDFPQADLVHNLLFKVMGLASHDWALVLNVYFLAGFPLIALSALAVLRQCRISWAPALTCSLLYAFLPGRLVKGEAHLPLDMYYQVPLMVLVALWVWSDEPPLVSDRGRGRWPALDIRRRRSLATLAIALLASGTGLYFAFFGTALIVLGGVWASLRRRTPHNALAALLIAGMIVAGLAAQAAPTLLYQRRNGPNELVAARSPHEAEMLGLKIADLLLPASGHRIPPLRRLKERYVAGAFPPGGEPSAVSLGLLGSVGFLSLLAVLFLGARPRDRPGDELFFPLAALNLVAVLIGTVGGFGSLFALLVTPEIRSYCRISVYIAFLALCALALLIQRAGGGRGPRTVALAAIALFVGLFDQATLIAIRPYREIADRYRADARFVANIEAAVPPRGMIFQLPYQSFPEAGARPGIKMLGYDPLHFYLLSRSVRWSFPTMAGRDGDAWSSAVARQEPARMVETLSDVDFDGILVDRHGYADHGAAIEAGLTRALGPARLISDDQRFAWFDLGPTQRAAAASLSAQERARRRDAALHPVLSIWGRGFFGDEVDVHGHFHWSSGTGVLEIANPWRVPQQAVFTTMFLAANPPLSISVTGDLLTERIEVPAEGARVSRTLTVPPGHHVIRFQGAGQPAYAPGDPRTMIWRLYNTELRALPGAAGAAP